jgi:hypothetical protein
MQVDGQKPEISTCLRTNLMLGLKSRNVKSISKLTVVPNKHGKMLWR